MLFVSLSSLSEIALLPKEVQAIELRLDLFPSIDFARLKEFLFSTPLTVLLTVRSKAHGGSFSSGQKSQEDLLEKLLLLHPHFLDLEYDLAPSFLEKLFTSPSSTQFVLSYHNMKEVPKDLVKIYEQMTLYPAFTYKIAVFPHSASEALAFLIFAKERPKLSAICMGKESSFARVLAAAQGNRIDFASLASAKTAPGQIPFEDLFFLYRYPQLNTQTALYGLIGDPVEQSQGDLYHNLAFAQEKQNAVYVKMRLQEEEIPHFLPLAKQIGFLGLSVTMPFKEKIIPFLDEMDNQAKSMQSVNTIYSEKGKYIGGNTDGTGALDAIESHTSVFGKKFVLVGAGGAGKAIAYEAKKRGADVLILNRTYEKAEELAKALGCKSGRFSDLPKEYDILVNASSSAIELKHVCPHAFIMDIVYVPEITPFLEKARHLGARIISGKEMFIHQAKAQKKYWHMQK
jgi:3-dehydroquinate dehydratase/shikimate dehydrogenase